MRKGTGASFSDGELSGHPTSHYQAYRYKKLAADLSGKAAIYGVLADGRLTFSFVDGPTGTRVHSVVSTAKLGFAPKAMATLNFNTILFTDDSGNLYRVDVITNNESLVFEPPVRIASGWTHDLLAYDGSNQLFGIADNVLLRYTVNAAEPAGGNISGRKPEGSLHHYIDEKPFDGDGGDLAGHGTVDASGWTQVLLSARPGTVS